ncbi:MAG: carboxypeptidase M32 [Clostridia bacterium]|nr:carboxypeptidase M32 [Clostridia bacterium]
MELPAALEALQKLQKTRRAYAHAQGILHFDGATVAPKASARARSATMGVLSEKEYQLFVNQGTRDLLGELKSREPELTQSQARQVELLTEELEQMTRIPIEEYVAYMELVNESLAVWEDAKKRDDFPLFLPYLEKVVDYTRRFARYKDGYKPLYDLMLDDYEKGMDQGTLDRFFEALRMDIVPLLAQVKDLSVEDGFLRGSFPKAAQEELARELMNVLGLDPGCFALAATEHPFTSSMHRTDVRITTHYYEDAPASSLYSVIHESGHALYDHGVAEEYDYTCLSEGASMGFHESQSRFYENIIGRSAAFAEFLTPVLRRFFPEQLKGVTPRQFYRAVNRAKPSLIRVDADELTYPLHVMVRYELEKKLAEGDLAAADLPEAWNSLYWEYLGVRVPNDREGVLQDTHWAGGSIGYFPTYALGSAYAAQIFNAMERDLPVEALAERGEMAPITLWLRERIHQHGKLYKPGPLLERVCGEPFDAKYYVAYLTSKTKDVSRG